MIKQLIEKFFSSKNNKLKENQLFLLEHLPHFTSLDLDERFLNDLVCRLIGKKLNASYVSILALNSRNDHLTNIGSFLNPKCLEQHLTYRKIDNLLDVYYLTPKIKKDNIEFCFNYYNQNKVNNSIISIEEFAEIKKQIRNNLQHIETFLDSVIKNDEYDLNTSNSTSIEYFKTFYSEKQSHIHETILNSSEIECLENLKTNLNINIDESLFSKYISLSLSDSGRIYGLLRIVFSNTESERLKIHSGLNSDSELFFTSIQQTISYVLESKFYSELHNKITHLNSTTSLHNNTILSTFYNEQANSLANILNCKAVLFRQINDVNEYNLIGKSTILENYPTESILENEVPIFFKQNKNCYAIEFEIPTKTNICLIGCNTYYSNTAKLYDETQFNVDFTNSSIFIKYCLANNLSKVLIVNIDAYRDTFIVLFNSRWRTFNSRDINLIQFVTNEIKTEINSKSISDRLENRRNAILNYHTHLDDLIKKNTIADNYITQFYSLTEEFLKELKFIVTFELFDYIKQIGVSSNNELIFNSIKSQGKLEIFNIPTTNEVSDYFLNIKNPKVFKSYVKEDEEDIRFFDLPVHSKEELSLIVTIGLKTNFFEQNNEDVYRFFIFLKQQLSLAWLKLERHILFNLQREIDDINNELIISEKLGERISMKHLGYRLCKLFSEQFNSELVTLFNVNDESSNLDLTSSNIRHIDPEISYNIKDESLSTVNSFNSTIDYRIFGKEKIDSNTNQKKLESLINHYRKYIIRNNGKFKSHSKLEVGQWLSVNINYKELSTKNLGIIKLFRFIDPKNEIFCEPYSEFHFTIIKQIKKYVFTVYNDIDFHIKELDNRLVDLRIVTHQVLAPALFIYRTLQILPKLPLNLHKRLYEDIHSQAGIMKAYTRNYERFLDIVSNEYPLEIVDIDLNEKLLQIAKYFQPLTRKKYITVHIEPLETKRLIKSDKFLIDHVVFNLIDNACKYSFYRQERVKNGFPPKYKRELDNIIDNIINVRIIPSIEQSKLTIDIWNLGHEILETEQTKIFELNFRGETAQTVDATGSGIGLFVASQIVKRLNGSISHSYGDNKNLNKFKIEIPI